LSSPAGLEVPRLGDVRAVLRRPRFAALLLAFLVGCLRPLGGVRCGGGGVPRLEVLHAACAAPWTRARADRGSPSSPSFEPEGACII
jgi:hypothetical protein